MASKSLRSHVSSPCWIETSVAARIGVTEALVAALFLLIFRAGCLEKTIVKIPPLLSFKVKFCVEQKHVPVQ